MRRVWWRTRNNRRRLFFRDFDVSCVARCEEDHTADESGRQNESVCLSIYHQFSDSSTEGSVCSLGSASPGTRYSPSTHRPRSTSLHRSVQKGRNSLFFQSTGLPQVGHFIAQDAQFTAQDAQFTAQDAQFTARDAQFTGQDAKFIAQDAQFTAQDAKFIAQDAQFTAQDAKSLIPPTAVGGLFSYYLPVINGFVKSHQRKLVDC